VGKTPVIINEDSPFKEYSILITKSGYRPLQRTLFSNHPGNGLWESLFFGGGISLLLATPALPSTLHPLTISSSILFMLASTSLLDRYHFLLVRKDGKRKISTPGIIKWKFPVNYFPSDERFNIYFATRKEVDSEGHSKRIILNLKRFSAQFDILSSFSHHTTYENLSLLFYPGKNFEGKFSLIMDEFKYSGFKIGINRLFPIWNGDYGRVFQVSAGIGGGKLNNKFILSVPLLVEVSVTEITSFFSGIEFDHTGAEKSIDMGILTGVRFLF